MEPKIRFKGFEGEWKELSLDDCVNFLDSKRKPIEEGNRTKGIFPYYGASGIVDYINDYIFDEELILLSEDGANITDRNYPVCFLAKGKYWVNNHAHVLKAKEGFINSFLCNAMERKDYTLYNTGMAMPKLNKEACKRIPVLHPSSNEQKAIASYFTSLDSQISASTSRLASLKQMKAASLQAMFPQEGETVPKVRFKGFEGEWKKVKADSIFKTFNEKNRPDLPVLSATQDRGMVTRESIGYNVFHDTSNEATYKHILPGQFVIHLRSFQGGFAHSEIEGIASPAYTILVFKNKDLYHDYYWRYVFMSKEFIKRLELITYGIRDGRSISYDEFKEMSFLVPSKEEQIKIASYLRNLDHQITLQTQRLEKLKQIKSACLYKMFV